VLVISAWYIVFDGYTFLFGVVVFCCAFSRRHFAQVIALHCIWIFLNSRSKCWMKVTIGLASSNFMLTWERLLIVEANFDKTKNRIPAGQPASSKASQGRCGLMKKKRFYIEKIKGL